MRKNYSKNRKRTLWAFDTEDNSKGKAFLFNFYNIEKDEHHTFKKQIEALDFVCSNYRSDFWAVNLEYDINNLFRDHYSLLEYIFAGSRLITASIKEDSIKFFDTLNHWHMSVKSMGERIGLPKIEIEHKGQSRASTKMVEYCKRDTEITGRFIKSMRDKYEKIGCKLKTTIASTTLDYFQREFYERCNHSFTDAQIDFFHEGYYGGRTEIFFNAPIEGKIFYHDLNSLYPYALKVGNYPVLEGYYETTSPNFEKEGMVEVTISASKNLSIPYLPKKLHGKLIFPVGIWTGTYTYFEIREAKKLGYKVLKIHKAIEFPNIFNPFTKFIDSVYEKRKEAKEVGDDLMQMSYKNLMNYCYGKFAQGNETTKLIPIKDTILKGGDTIFGDLVLRKEKKEYAAYANCVWSCYCTAFARHVLYYDGLSRVNSSGGMLLYCDTDSVIYESSNQIIEDSKELGKFKLEGVFKYAHFKLPKLYTLKTFDDIDSYKAKGVPKSVQKDFFLTGKAKYQKPNKLRETLRRNLSPKRTLKLVPNYWESREKELVGKYNKRRVLKNGNTLPIILKEEKLV